MNQTIFSTVTSNSPQILCERQNNSRPWFSQ